MVPLVRLTNVASGVHTQPPSCLAFDNENLDLPVHIQKYLDWRKTSTILIADLSYGTNSSHKLIITLDVPAAEIQETGRRSETRGEFVI
jgi:hypothetical protein